MNDFMKMLAISYASVMVITNYGTAHQACVRPVQGFVSLGVYGAHSKIDGKFSQWGKLKDSNVSTMLKQISNGGIDISEADADNLKKLVGIKLGDLKYNNFDKNNTITLLQLGSGSTASKEDPILLKPSVSSEKTDDGYLIKYKTDFTGTFEAIAPKNSMVYEYTYQDDGTLSDKIGSGSNAITKEDLPVTNQTTVYNEKHPAPIISQLATLDTSNLKDLYKITLSDNSWTGKGWQMAGFANLGLLVNFSQGGAWYLSVFGAKPFINSTQNITFGNTSSNKGNNNNSNSIEAKDKWSLGIETGLRCNITEKVYLGIGVGVQWSWYEFSLKNSSENKDNNDSNTLKQDMKGTAPFMKLSLGFNINKNFGIEIFGKCTGKHDLKYKDGKKSKDDKSSNSSEWPINFTKQCSPSFGIAATFTF